MKITESPFIGLFLESQFLTAFSFHWRLCLISCWEKKKILSLTNKEGLLWGIIDRKSANDLCLVNVRVFSSSPRSLPIIERESCTVKQINKSNVCSVWVKWGRTWKQKPTDSIWTRLLKVLAFQNAVNVGRKIRDKSETSIDPDSRNRGSLWGICVPVWKCCHWES